MKKNNTKLTVTWYGHSAFLLESPAGTRVLIDPFLTNPKAPAGAKDISPVDLILITHGHDDHIGSTIEVAQRTGAKVIAIHEVSLYLKRHGITNIVGMNKGATIEAANVQVTMVDARHSSGIDVEDLVVPGGEAAGYVVEFENKYRVYHAGDTAPFGDMKLIKTLYKPHLCLLPIGGLFTMGPKDAAFCCTMLQPQTIIGMHYGTYPPLTGTPELLKKYLPANMKKKVVTLEPGVSAAI